MSNCKVIEAIKEAVNKARLDVNNPRAMARLINEIDSIAKLAPDICQV